MTRFRELPCVRHRCFSAFLPMWQVSASDYVRKRKLSLAAGELKNSSISVIDVAVKYGFNSHSAFARAFKEQHGATPTEARTSAINEYPALDFADMRFIGGKRVMAELKKITFGAFEERLIAGMHRETTFSNGGKIWREFFTSDAYGILASFETKRYDDIDPYEGIGFMFEFKDRDSFTIVIGDFAEPNARVPNGLFVKHIPQSEAAYVQIEGNSVADILSSAFMLITESVEKAGRAIDFGHFFWCEIYTVERFGEPQRRGEKVIIDYIMPVLP